MRFENRELTKRCSRLALSAVLIVAVAMSSGCGRAYSSREAASAYVVAVVTGDSATASSLSTMPFVRLDAAREDLLGTSHAGRTASVKLKSIERHGRWECWEVVSITVDGKTKDFAEQPFTYPPAVWVHGNGSTYKVAGVQATVVAQ